jgi:putative tricarboxylic transport membrane protein
MLHNLLGGLSGVLTLGAFPYLILGMCIGMFVAMLPGLGVGIALSLMLTFLYHMQPTAAILLMLGTLAGEYFSASITAILLNTPGAPESYPTTHDGFPMAQRGEAGRALAISASCTWLGGWTGCVIFILLMQIAGSLIAAFKPPEYAAIIIFALIVVGQSGGQSGSIQASKAIVSGGFGFMISFVGSDPVSGTDRFSGGLSSLTSGINIVPFALGVFAVTQMVIMYGTGKSVTDGSDRVRIENFSAQIRVGVKDTLTHPIDLLRSAIIASGLGLIPGIGGFTANYISYGVGQKASRAGNRFGTGVPAGVISAEGSSLAKEVGSLVPAVTLGLPSGVGMVLFIAALSIIGLQPGLPLVTGHATLPYSMMWGLAIAGFLSCWIGLFLAPYISKITRIRGPVLLPSIGGLAVLGSFSAVVNTAGIIEMFFFVMVGVLARKCNYSVAAMAVGLVLGSTFDDNTFLTLQSYGFSFLWRSPLATVVLAAAALVVIKKTMDTHRQRRSSRESSAGDGVHGELSMDVPWALQMVVDGIFVAGSAGYLLVALGYPKTAGIIPAATAAVVGGVSAVRLAADVWRRVQQHRLAGGGAGQRVTGAVALGIAEAAAGAGEPGLPGDEPHPRAMLRPADRFTRHSPAVEAFQEAPAVEAPQKAAGMEIPDRVSRNRAAAVNSDVGYQESSSSRFGISVREIVAVLWAGSFVAGVLLLGFRVGIPLAAFLYCLFGIRMTSWRTKAVFTVCTVGLLYVLVAVFLSVFHLTYSGIIV